MPRVSFERPGPELFEQFIPASWRGIEFPISSMKVAMSQDLVHHKYWGVDSARVEATGRSPMEIDAEIPFVNGIVPGKGESWGKLYPDVFIDLLKSFADRSTGTLIHPELGEITCKPVSIDFALDAQRRDGVVVSARWIETLAPNEDGAVAAKASPITEVALAALDLDASKDDILALVPDAVFPTARVVSHDAIPQREKREETFDSLVNKMAGFVDSTTIAVTLLAAKPDQILNRVRTLQDSLERARTALTWQAEHQCERFKEMLYAIKNLTGSDRTQTVYGTGSSTVASAGKPGKRIRRWSTPCRMTLGAIFSALPGNTVDDIIKLNPFLVNKPEVGEGTVVRYYDDGTGPTVASFTPHTRRNG